ncbi:MAG: SCP2 domain-containing protein [Sulfurifustis sp.]
MIAAGLLEATVNRVLQLDPDAKRRFAELDGKTILIELAREGAIERFYVMPSADRLRVAREYDRLPDVTISATPSVFLNQLLRGPTVSDALVIRGDVDLGQRFQRILSRLSPDWEEGLARVVGDIAAHQMMRFVRGFVGWGRQAMSTLGQDAAEYLQEEAFVLAKRERLAEFLRGVDEVRAGADRLEKRLQRLGQRR